MTRERVRDGIRGLSPLMKTRILSVLALMVAVLPLRGLGAERPAALKVLMVCGGCCHDYTVQKKLISEGVAKRINATFTIRHDDAKEAATREHKASVYASADWAKGYDLVLHSECYGAVKEVDFLERITAPHKAGLPAVFLHCSMHSYRMSEAADQWRELIGVKSTSHEKYRPLTVRLLQATHPIMRGFPDGWITPKGDELYKVEKFHDTATALAKAYGEDTKQEHPIVWVNQNGKIRSFSTTLGHGNEVVETKEYLDLVARGILWVSGKLKEDGTPAEGFGPANP
ncbi:MAG: hypothetical protein RIS92_1981 [Verrucomicrobiota bacterium]